MARCQERKATGHESLAHRRQDLVLASAAADDHYVGPFAAGRPGMVWVERAHYRHYTHILELSICVNNTAFGKKVWAAFCNG
jgi:hypothetical protein